MEEGLERLQEAKKQKVCCEIMSPKSIRQATPMKYHQYGCLNKNWGLPRVGEMVFHGKNLATSYLTSSGLPEDHM